MLVPSLNVCLSKAPVSWEELSQSDTGWTSRLILSEVRKWKKPYINIYVESEKTGTDDLICKGEIETKMLENKSVDIKG